MNDVFAKGGAMEALLEMKEQKVVRFSASPAITALTR